MKNIELLHGDCLEVMKEIPAGSVDLVLTDPPYGTMKGAELDCWNSKTMEWDTALDPVKLFEQISRILRPNGKAILFSQEPYTSRLITSALPSLPFAYRAIWYKNVHANALLAKTAMVNRFEDICIFRKVHPKHDFGGGHPLREYARRVFEYIGSPKKEIIREVGQCADHFFRFKSSQFTLCTETTYCKLINRFHIDSMTGFVSFDTLQKIDAEYRTGLVDRMNEQHPSVFNLWEGGASKNNVLEYAKDGGGFHPTQKPVLLLEDLIKTFSNEGDVVTDFTMGSGSTGVACVNTGRHFIGIELDPGYFEIAQKRIAEAVRR